MFVAKTKFVNLYPNIFYLINSYENAYSDILKNKLSRKMNKNKIPSTYLHEDGWLEVNTTMDSFAINKRVKQRIENYHKNYLPVYKFSNVRYKYLKKTIEVLKTHGKVYLVRLPIHKTTLQIENQFMPDFNQKILSLSEETNSPFMNFTDSTKNYLFVDDNHLYKSAGKIVSKEIADWIVKSHLPK